MQIDRRVSWLVPEPDVWVRFEILVKWRSYKNISNRKIFIVSEKYGIPFWGTLYEKNLDSLQLENEGKNKEHDALC